MDENFLKPAPTWTFRLPWRRKVSAADVAKLQAKTNKRSRKLHRALDKQKAALQAWGASLSDENRDMIFHYVRLVDQLGDVLKFDGPCDAMEGVAAREAKREELVAKDQKLVKQRAHVAVKYGPKCTQALELGEEIKENRSRIALSLEQLAEAIGVELRAALKEYLGKMKLAVGRVGNAADRLAIGDGGGELECNFEVSEVKVDKEETATEEVTEVEEKIEEKAEKEVEDLPKAKDQPWARMPSMFARALTIVGKKVRRGDMEKKILKPEDTKYPYPADPKEIKALLGKQALERKENRAQMPLRMASRLEAEKIGKTELQNEWANVDNDIDEKLQGRGTGANGTVHRVWNGW